MPEEAFGLQGVKAMSWWSEASDTNFDTTDGEMRGHGGVFNPMKSTPCHRQTPPKKLHGDVGGKG